MSYGANYIIPTNTRRSIPRFKYCFFFSSNNNKSLVNMLKIYGPIHEPCGTPFDKVNHSLYFIT